MSQSELLAKVRARAAVAEAQPPAPPSAREAAHVSEGAAMSASPTAAASARATTTTPRKPGLSKKVEYPGDAPEIARLLSEMSVDPGGKDMFGLTALHKFAACNVRS